MKCCLEVCCTKFLFSNSAKFVFEKNQSPRARAALCEEPKVPQEKKSANEGVGKGKARPCRSVARGEETGRDALETLKQGEKGMGCSLYTRTSLRLLWLIEVRI